MKVIGLRGHIAAGKTTLANALMAKYPAQVIVANMAGPLKRGLAEMGITKEDAPEIYRKAAQTLGTDIVRAIDPGFWVRRFKERLDYLRFTKNYDFVIVDDIRFKNEASCCDKIFYVARNGTYKLHCDLATAEHVHDSEYWAYSGPDNGQQLIFNYDGKLNDAVIALAKELGLAEV